MAIFCNEESPDWQQQDCGVERAGIVAMVLIDPSVGTPSNANIQSPTYWNTLVNQSPPLAIIIKKTRGEYPRPTVTSEEGFGRESKQNTGADHILNWEVEGLEENRDNFEIINRKKWKQLAITSGDLGLYVDVPVTVDGRENVPKDIKAAAFWMVESAWTDFSNPRVIDVSMVPAFQE